MPRQAFYFVTEEQTEDRAGSASNLEEALRLADRWVRTVEANTIVNIEHQGIVIRQFRRIAEGRIEEIEPAKEPKPGNSM